MENTNQPNHLDDETLPQIDWDKVEEEASLLLEKDILAVEAVNNLIQKYSRVAHKGISLLQYALKNRIIESEQFVQLRKLASKEEKTKSGNWSCIREKNKPPIFESTLETFGPYKIISTLGRGGMGVVYKALDTRLNRIVALKMLREDNLTNKKSIKRFLQEGKSAAKLSHPRIVSIYELGEINEVYYISMEHIEGETLDNYFKKKQVSTRNKVQILLEIAEALAEAHKQNIIHRDLKPSNIIIDPHGHPNIMDFGLAKDLASETKLTRSGEFMGTPRYMSPEQVKAKKGMNAQLDQFALGIIFYEMLTNRVPFHGTQIQVFNQILRKNPPSPSHYAKALPKELSWICTKLLEKEPQDRYSSMEGLANDLRIFLAGGELKISRISLMSSKMRRLRIYKIWFILGILLTTIGSIVGWKYLQKTKKLQQMLIEQKAEKKQKKQAQQEQEKKTLKEKQLTQEKVAELFLKIVKNKGLIGPQIQEKLKNLKRTEIPFLIPYLKDERFIARMGIARAFELLAFKEAIPALKETLSHATKEEEKVVLLKTLDQLKAPFLLAELSPYFRSSSKKTKRFAFRCANTLPTNKETTTILLKLFQDHLEEEKILAAILAPFLAKGSKELVLEALKEGAKKENSSLKLACLKALGKLKAPGLLSLFDPKEKVTEILLLQIELIKKLKLTEGIPELFQKLQHPHLKIALTASEALVAFVEQITSEEKDRWKTKQNYLSKRVRSLSLYRGQAKRYMNLKEYGEALEKLNEMLKISPDEEAFRWRGKCYAELGKNVKSVEDYIELIKREPTAPNYVELANAVGRIGMHKQALEFYDKALARDPENLDALQDKGTSLIFEGRYDEAIQALNEALKLEKNLVTGYQMLGQAYTFKGRYLRAIQMYKKALELDPSAFGIYLTLGNVYLQKNMLVEARRYFQESINLNPDKDGGPGHYFIGETYFREEDYKKAMECFTKSLEINPKDINTLIRIAEIEWHQGNIQEAHQYLNEALKQREGTYSLTLQAKLFYEEKRFEEAIQGLEKVTAENSEQIEHYVDAMYILARCYFAAKRYQKAFDTLKVARSNGYPVSVSEWNAYRSKIPK